MMNRRTFVAGVAACVVAAPAIALPKRRGIAVSVKDYGAVHGRVTVDGVESKLCVFADENAGMVREMLIVDRTAVRDVNGATVLRERFGVVRISWPEHPEIEAMYRRAA